MPLVRSTRCSRSSRSITGEAPRVGLRELARVGRRVVVLHFDPEVHSRYWLFDDYLPECNALRTASTPRLPNRWRARSVRAGPRRSRCRPTASTGSTGPTGSAQSATWTRRHAPASRVSLLLEDDGRGAHGTTPCRSGGRNLAPPSRAPAGPRLHRRRVQARHPRVDGVIAATSPVAYGSHGRGRRGDLRRGVHGGPAQAGAVDGGGWPARSGYCCLADLVSYIVVQTADGTWSAKTSLPLPLCDVGRPRRRGGLHLELAALGRAHLFLGTRGHAAGRRVPGSFEHVSRTSCGSST